LLQCLFNIPVLMARLYAVEPTLETTSSPAPQSTPPNTKEIQPRRKKQANLAGRLVRAAVLAHVNPTERLRRRLDSKIDDPSRRALQFIDEAHSPVKMISRGRTATLIDPRKIAPFHEPYFSTRGSQPPSPVMKTRKHKPVTKWKSACHLSPSSDSRAITNASAVHYKASTRVPLSFIPLKDAEMAYSSKLTSAQSILICLFSPLLC